MMHLLVIAAVLAGLSIGDAAPRLPVPDEAWRLTGVLLLTSLLAAAGPLATYLGLNHIRRCGATGLRLVQRGQYAYAVGGVACAAWAILQLRWPQVVRCNWGLGSWVLVDELLIIAPLLSPLIAMWASIVLVAGRAGRQSPASAGRLFLLQLRHYLGLILAPILLVLAIGDTLDLCLPRWEQQWPFHLLSVALVCLLFPLLLRLVWQTQRLPDGTLRRRLETVIQRANLRVRDILVWRTEGEAVNAAMTGLTSTFRYVLLTDGLLQRFSEDEVEAVVLHEVAHARRGHLFCRLATVGLPLWIGLGVAAAPNSGAALAACLEELGVAVYLQTTVLLPLLVTCYCAAALSWFSRLLEHDADLWACRLAARGASDTQSQPHVERYVAMLEQLAKQSGTDRERSAWLHPSIAQRVRILRVVGNDPELFRRFQRKLILTVAGAAGMCLLAVCTLIWHG